MLQKWYLIEITHFTVSKLITVMTVTHSVATTCPTICSWDRSRCRWLLSLVESLHTWHDTTLHMNHSSPWHAVPLSGGRQLQWIWILSTLRTFLLLFVFFKVGKLSTKVFAKHDCRCSLIWLWWKNVSVGSSLLHKVRAKANANSTIISFWTFMASMTISFLHTLHHIGEYPFWLENNSEP